MLKILIYTFIFSKSYIVMKYSIRLVSHWTIRFDDRNLKYSNDKF